MACLYYGELSRHEVAELTVRTGFKISLRRLGVLLTLLLVPSMGGAATSRFGETVTVTPPVSDDAYLAGGRVAVEQPLASDAVAAGGTVLFNAPVGLDLLGSGGNLFLNGSVGDDARVAGGKGFLFFVLTPMSTIVLAVTVIGLPLGLFLFLLFLFTVWLTPSRFCPPPVQLVVALLPGLLLLGRGSPSTKGLPHTVSGKKVITTRAFRAWRG